MTVSSEDRSARSLGFGFGVGVPGASGRAESDGPGTGRTDTTRPVAFGRPIGRNAAAAAIEQIANLRRSSVGPFPQWSSPLLSALPEIAAAARGEFGASADRPHLVPTQADLVRAIEVAREDVALGRADRFAARHHWTVPTSSFVARCGVALERGAAVLVIATARFESVLGPAIDALADTFGKNAVSLAVDDRLDAVRRIASEPDIELEVHAPDEFVRGEQSFLESRRNESASDDASRSRDGQDARSDEDAGWFGAGIVEAPTARIRVRAPSPVVVECRMDRDDDVVFVANPPCPVRSSPEPTSRADLRSVAIAIAEAAFGERVLGGYSIHAASIAQVDATLFSALTAALLQVLHEREVAPAHPNWITEKGHDGSPPLASGLDETIQAGRRIALDEGATLVFECERRGQRSTVFTNVDTRMRIGAALHVPATLALQRV